MMYEPQGDSMTASTATARKGLGRRATMLLLGAMIACLGVFAFSTSQAKAAPFSMDLDNGTAESRLRLQGR